ncbi:MAG: hypothetical protein LUE29_04635 [Lachnospiraceae bacterium]|nr:hypothetical protein [Lachnospiraceae bacterium]
MMEFNWADGVNEANGKHDMQDWMVAEKMYNCDGFSSNYYREQTAGAKRRFPFFGKKNM